MMLADGFMNLQDGAITALLFMVSFSGVLLKILWDRSSACEKRDVELQKVLREQAEKIGLMQGMLNLMKYCPVQACPYRPHLPSRVENGGERLTQPQWPEQSQGESH